MMKSKQFFLAYIMATLSIFTGFFVVNVQKDYARLNDKNNDTYLSSMASIGSFFISARFVWSILLDRFSFKWVYGTLLVMQVVLGATMLWAVDDIVIYSLWVWLILFCEGGHFTLFPNLLRQLFGDQATQLYGIFFSYSGICSIIQIFLQKWFLKGDDPDSYDGFFLLNAIFSGVAFLLLMFIFDETPYAVMKANQKASKA